MYDRADRAHVTWDIETTGFASTDEITVTGFWFPGGHATIIVNAGPHAADADALAASLDEASGAAVRVRIATDEADLFAALEEVLFERFDRAGDRLVAFNADSWRSGFDLPFLRTRCIHHGVDWVFEGLSFADLWDPVAKYLNTTRTSADPDDEVNTLTGAYELLVRDTDRVAALLDDGGGHVCYRESSYDPFDDSASAVAHYERGDLQAVCLHNLADVHRTWELGELVRAFVAPKDISDKKL